MSEKDKKKERPGLSHHGGKEDLEETPPPAIKYAAYAVTGACTVYIVKTILELIMCGFTCI